MSYTDELLDQIQRMRFAGDALAAGLAAFLPDNYLLHQWDEAKEPKPIESTEVGEGPQ